jgi:hypothetical protein
MRDTPSPIRSAVLRARSALRSLKPGLRGDMRNTFCIDHPRGVQENEAAYFTNVNSDDDPFDEWAGEEIS